MRTAVMTVLIGLMTALPAAAERPAADVTPGCVSWAEYDRASYTTSTFSEVRSVFLVPGHKRPNFDAATGLDSPRRYVTFEYSGCDGAMAIVVYERPNKRHPGIREWVGMMWKLPPTDTPVSRRLSPNR